MGETREAGRELDALIAEKVMGGRWDRGALYSHVYVEPTGWLLAQRDRERFGDDELHVYEGALPYYSTEIAAAWRIVEEISGFDTGRDKPWWSMATFYAQRGQIGCRVYACPPGSSIFDADDVIAEAIGDTAPHAICRAALQAVDFAARSSRGGEDA